MAQHNELGRLGEKKVFDFLVAKGYQIIATNWRYEKSELDIVCEYKNLIVFVEVKTRSTDDFGKPAEFVTAAQQTKLIEGAEAFLEEKNLENEIRFDIVEVLAVGTNFSINHIENAFTDGM